MIQRENPEKLGLSSERLGRLQDWLAEQVTSGRLAGASAVVGRHGKMAFASAVGAADIEQQQPFSQDTLVRIFSMTKPITTTAAMMLYEEGHFQLDDPIARYLPEFIDTPVWIGGDAAIDQVEAQQSPVTVRQLMNHTSGMTYEFMNTTAVDQYYRSNEINFQGTERTLEQTVRKLASAPLLCQPGTQWNYSVSTDVLGRLVEVWSGLSLDVFFRSRILEPLQMNDTGFHVEPHNHQRFASLYGPKGGGDMSSVGRSGKSAVMTSPRKPDGLSLLDPASSSRYTRPTPLFSGGGGLTGSIDDYARFCQMIINGGELDGVRLLGPLTVDYMCRNQLGDNRDMAALGQPVWSETSYEGIGFGLGFAVVLDPVKAHVIASPGECHWGGAASTFFWVDRTQDLFVVFFTQLMPSSTWPLRRELRTRVYQAVVNSAA